MNPRGIGLEWFAVVNNTSKPQIKNYASTNGTSSSYFTTSCQLLPFNNIVTTLMTDMSDTFYDVNGFNQDIGSWNTSRVTTMERMFDVAIVLILINPWHKTSCRTFENCTTSF